MTKYGEKSNGSYCQGCDDKSHGGSEILVSINVLRGGHPDHAVIQLGVPVVPQLFAPLKVEGGVYLILDHAGYDIPGMDVDGDQSTQDVPHQLREFPSDQCCKLVQPLWRCQRLTF